MPWYVAGCILAVVAEIDDSGPVSVYENFVLFEAADFEEAEAKATARGKLEEAAGDDMRVNGHKAKMHFLGIRTLRAFMGVATGGNILPPTDGDEVAYCYFEVSNIDCAKRLAAGEVVEVTDIAQQDPPPDWEVKDPQQ
jgi:hypothetical protein